MPHFQGFTALAKHLECNSQLETARLLNLHTSQVNTYWRPGYTHPALRTLEDVAHTLNMPMSKLIAILYGEEFV